MEAIAVVAQYDPFFEEAGMTKIVERFPSHNLLDAIEKLRKLGFNPVLLGSIEYNLEKLKSMNPRESWNVRKSLHVLVILASRNSLILMQPMEQQKNTAKP